MNKFQVYYQYSNKLNFSLEWVKEVLIEWMSVINLSRHYIKPFDSVFPKGNSDPRKRVEVYGNIGFGNLRV